MISSPRPFVATLVMVYGMFAMPLAGTAQRSAPGLGPSSRTFDLSVRDSAAGVALRGVRVATVRDTAHSAVTDSVGHARLTVEMSPGDTLIASLRGFRRYARPLDNGGEEFLSFDVVMKPAPQELAELRVEANGAAVAIEGRLADFERRRTSGNLGTFITADLIDRRRPVRVTDIFRGLSGVRVIDSASVRLVVSNRGPNPSLVSKSVQGGPCVLRVIVDGILRSGTVNLDDLDAKEIHGIEIYVGPGSIPPAFSSMQPGAWCGLIVVWTK